MPASPRRPRRGAPSPRRGGHKTDPCCGRFPAGAYWAAVPHYFFHLYNDIVAMDEEGRTLPDLDAARVNAVREAREMMLETIAEGRINFSHRIDIADESGTVIESVRFGEAVSVQG